MGWIHSDGDPEFGPVPSLTAEQLAARAQERARQEAEDRARREAARQRVIDALARAGVGDADGVADAVGAALEWAAYEEDETGRRAAGARELGARLARTVGARADADAIASASARLAGYAPAQVLEALRAERARIEEEAARAAREAALRAADEAARREAFEAARRHLLAAAREAITAPDPGAELDAFRAPELLRRWCIRPRPGSKLEFAVAFAPDWVRSVAEFGPEVIEALDALRERLLSDEAKRAQEERARREQERAAREQARRERAERAERLAREQTRWQPGAVKVGRFPRR